MSGLISDTLLNDPEFCDAKQQILTTVEKYQKTLTHVKAAEPSLKLSYEETIAQLSAIRGQNLFYPFIGSGFGKGALIELADGSVKYDFINGVGTHWGHCHLSLIAASIDASIQDICTQTNLQHNRDSYALINLLSKQSGLPHCFLTTSGAMANENALKIIFQKRAPAHRVLAFEGCFLGRTLALAQITDKPHFREGLPCNFQIDYVPFYDWRNPKESTERTLFYLRKYLQRYPNAYACMCFEMIQGESGCYPGKKDFFVSLMQLLKEHNIAIFVDEVQSFARTDHLFAFQHFELQEYVDVVTCGKILQACATLFSKEFKPKPWLLTQTFTAPTSSIRVGYTILQSLLTEGYLGPDGKNMQLRKHIVEHLQRLANTYPEKVEGPFGYGLMIACTLFKGDKNKVMDFVKALFDAGLIVFIAGSNPTRLRLLVSPAAVTLDDIDQAMVIFEETLRDR